MLGLLSCIIVVCVVSCTLSVLQHTPILLLRVAENEKGQYDMRLESSKYFARSLNYTMIKERLKKGIDEKDEEDDVKKIDYSLIAPRIEIIGSNIYKLDSCMNNDNETYEMYDDEEDMFLREKKDFEWMYYGKDENITCGDNCVIEYCERRFSGNVYVYDTLKEKSMGYGRKWDEDELKEGEIVVSRFLAQSLDLVIGDIIIFDISVRQINNILSGPFNEVDTNSNSTVNKMKWKSKIILLPVRVVSIKDDFFGKVDWEMGEEIIMMEYKHFLGHVSKYIHPQIITDSERKKISKVNMYQFAPKIMVNIPNRIQSYKHRDFDVVKNRVSKFCSEVLYLTGFDQVFISYPILIHMNGMKVIGLFLNLIVNIIICILIGLCVFLIYSLLSVDVEDRTFDIAVLRMLGLKLNVIIQLMNIHAMLFSLPGIFFGVFAGQFVYFFVSIVLTKYFGVKIPMLLNFGSISLSILIGFCIPILGVVFPIKTALGKRLNDSLDTKRSKTKAVKITVERANENDASLSLLVCSGFGFGFGFVVYYFFPLALISMKISLLLTMFFCVLCMMLLGFIILSLNVESILSKILVYLLLFWENTAVLSIVIKNFISHKERNRRTIIMYGISLAFLIFIAVAFKLEISIFGYKNTKQHGTRFILRSHSHAPLKEEFLKRLDNFVLDSNSILSGYGYKSFPIRNLLEFSEIKMRNIGGYTFKDADISAISPNYFEIVDQRYLIVNEAIKSPLKSYSSQLYSNRGSYSSLIGYNIKVDMGLKSTDSNFIVQMKKEDKMSKRDYKLFRASSIFESAATTSFSKFSSSGISGNYKTYEDLLISFPAFMKLMNYNSIWNIPIQYIYLKVKPSATKNEIGKFKSKMKKAYLGLNHLSLRDTDDKLLKILIVENVMKVFFAFSTVVVMNLCFFSLISNMYTNIHHQSKEIGILRAIGSRKFTVRRIYMYEALILIYSASIIGIIIGTAIGYTMILQQQLFTQLPLPFVFPYEIALAVCLSGIVFAFLASIFPINQLLSLPVVSIFRKKQ